MAAIALCGGVEEFYAPSGLQQPIARQVPPVGLGAPCRRQAGALSIDFPALSARHQHGQGSRAFLRPPIFPNSF